jgi:integrase
MGESTSTTTGRVVSELVPAFGTTTAPAGRSPAGAASEKTVRSRLLLALHERATFPEGDLAAGTRLGAATAVWLADLDASTLTSSTRQLYRAAARLYLIPTLGDVRLGELTPTVIDRALGIVRLQHGPHAARTARRALSNLCRTAVRHGATPVNPVASSRPITCPRKRERALTPSEVGDLLTRLRADHIAVALDLPDFVQFMLGTGLRIGEVAAVRDSVLDLHAATIEVNATVVRVDGIGVQIQPRTKTDGSHRILALPPSLVDLIERRLADGHRPGPAGVIFTSPFGLIRDPSNTQADLRQAMTRIGYPWVTSREGMTG